MECLAGRVEAALLQRAQYACSNAFWPLAKTILRPGAAAARIDLHQLGAWRHLDAVMHESTNHAGKRCLHHPSPPDLAGTELHGVRGHRTGEIAPVEKTPPWDKLL